MFSIKRLTIIQACLQASIAAAEKRVESLQGTKGSEPTIARLQENARELRTALEDVTILLERALSHD